MKNTEITRRGFLKIAGVTSVISGASVLGLPTPLQAAEKKGSRFLRYARGEYTPSYCEMCFWKCGVDAYTVNGVLRKLEGNKLNPNNLGHICAKGNAGIHSTYDPDRVQYPMLRVGKRGEGKWKKISWDEAYDYIHKQLTPLFEKYGTKTLATFIHGTGESYVHSLAYALGSPNVAVPSYSQCIGSREIAWSKTFGYGLSGHEVYDMANTKNMIVFGRNLAGAVHVGEAERFVEGIARGAKLTYIDPRLTESSVKGKWLQIKPGTDMALALALIHVIIRDNLTNYNFVRNNCYGYNELREHIKQYTPKWAEEKTGISASVIEETAWDFAKDAPHVLAIAPRRLTRYGFDVQTARAIAILNALMGNVGVPGGQMMSTPPPVKAPKEDHPPHPHDPRADGAGGSKFPFAPENLGLADGLYTATLTADPYPIKAWLLYATNPLGHGATQNGQLWKAMDNVDFILAIDTQLSDSAYYADLVLPESTYLERDDTPLAQKDYVPFVCLRKAAIKPVYDTKHVFDICQGIAKRFGMEKYFAKSPTQITEEFMASLTKEQADTLLKDGVLVFDKEANPYPQARGDKLTFATTTGKIQLYVPEFEPHFKEKGDAFAPMPTYIEPKMPAEGQLRLLMGRAPNHSHGRSQNNWILMESHGDGPIWIHPNDAKKLKLVKGDKVKVTNVTTNYQSKAQDIYITKRIKENSVFIHHGFGHITKAWKIGYNVGISDTDFCSHDIDPISGACGFNNGFVTIKKA